LLRPGITRGDFTSGTAVPKDVVQFVVVMLGPLPQKSQYTTSGSSVQVMMTAPSPASTLKSFG
jgi:hypothetical protein